MRLWIKLSFCLLASIAAIWIGAPYAAKTYLHNKYPFVHIDKASVSFPSTFVLYDIQIRKPNLDAKLHQVKVDVWHSRIYATGGAIHYTKSNSSGGTHTSAIDKYSIEARDISAVIDTNNYVIDAQGISYVKNKNIDEFKIESGSIAKRSGKEFKFYDASGPRNLDHVHFGSIAFSYVIPFKLPTITNNAYISAHNVDIFPSKQKAKIESIDIDVGEKLHTVHIKSAILWRQEDDVQLRLGSLSLWHPWISKKPLIFSNLLLQTTITHPELIVAVIGSAIFKIDAKNYSIAGSNTCNNWMHALPIPLPDALSQSISAGSYSGSLSFDIKIKPHPVFKLKHDCRFRCSQKPIAQLFDNNGFDYIAYDAKDKPFKRHVGFGIGDWTFISGISPEVAMAVTTLEDPGFQSHNGIIPIALQNALTADLETGKFLRGGSTITMQLAKNLWLGRQKTILRKAQEALLTFALESCLTKDKILEIYLNIVEFGPNIYGIKAASHYYFHKEPYQLRSDEAFYLAMLLPHPLKAVPPEQGGLEMAHSLMRRLSKNGFFVGDVEDY